MNSAALKLIVHDLKNALGSLEGELQTLAASPSQDLAQQAHAHCAALRRQFVQFLTVYGSGEGLQARCEDESPLDLLQSLKSAQAGAGGIRIEVVCIEQAPAFWYVDRRLLRLALDAALHNALRFARSRVTLGLRQQDGFLVFMIDDDGPGLGAADASSHATGLGTELCRQVACAHHLGERQGRIQLFNQASGGARFELWLP